MEAESTTVVIDLSLEQALAQLVARARRVKGSDRITPQAAVGRVLIEDVGTAEPPCVVPAGQLLDRADAARLAALGLNDIPVRRLLALGFLSTASSALLAARLTASLTSSGCTVEQVGVLDVMAPRATTCRLLRKAGALHDVVLSFGVDLARADDALRNAMCAEGALTVWRITDIECAELGVGALGPADHLALPADTHVAEALFESLALPFLRACQGRVTTS